MPVRDTVSEDKSFAFSDFKDLGAHLQNDLTHPLVNSAILVPYNSLASHAGLPHVELLAVEKEKSEIASNIQHSVEVVGTALPYLAVVAAVSMPLRKYLARSGEEGLPGGTSGVQSVLSEQWHHDASLAGADDHKLVLAIAALPKHEQMSALKVAFEKFSQTYYLPDQLHSMPASDLPAITKMIFLLPEESGFGVRSKSLLRLGEWTADIKDMPIDERTAIVKGAFEAGFANSLLGDEQALQLMWTNMPHGGNQGMVEHLLSNFDSRDLSKVVFSWANPEVIDKFAYENPVIIRNIASVRFQPTDSSEIRQLVRLVDSWQTHGSFTKLTEDLLNREKNFSTYSHEHVVPLLLEQLGAKAKVDDKIEALQLLRKDLLDSSSERSASIYQNRMIASSLSKSDFATSALVQEHYLKPVNSHLANPDVDFSERLYLAGSMAAVERAMPNAALSFEIPDLRLAKQFTGLSSVELGALKSSIEEALRKPELLSQMFGDGSLGKMFPTVFGKFETDGGIVGRPQHGGHEFLQDEHTRQVVERTSKHPLLAELSDKDQTNVLWAALMHDTGKRAGVAHPGHEWASSNLSWGVLRTLGYEPTQIQRITALVSRHSEASFNPRKLLSETFAEDDSKLDDLATYYRHPAAVKQLQILNESDIKSIANESKSWFKPNVASEISSVTSSLQTRVDALNIHSVPLLTTSVPQNFGIYPLNKPYAVLAHASDFLHDRNEFLKHLGVIESPEFSISASLLTNDFSNVFREHPIVALVAGPSENMSQIYRTDVGTGKGVDWDGHIRLTKSWADGGNVRAPEFASEVEEKIRSVGVNFGGTGKSLEHLRGQLSQFDSIDELVSARGADDSYVHANEQIIHSLTHEKNGNVRSGLNEIKLNNPTVVGFGILRKGQDIHFENLDSSESLAQVFGTAKLPDYVQSSPAISNSGSADAAKVVSESIWRAAIARDLPFVILDP